MSDYTNDEREKVYNLTDQLEDAALRLAAIVTAKRQRDTTTSKWFRFLPGVHTVIDGKPFSSDGVRIEMTVQRAAALIADVSQQIADGESVVEAVFIGQMSEDDEADE